MDEYNIGPAGIEQEASPTTIQYLIHTSQKCPGHPMISLSTNNQHIPRLPWPCWLNRSQSLFEFLPQAPLALVLSLQKLLVILKFAAFPRSARYDSEIHFIVSQSFSTNTLFSLDKCFDNVEIHNLKLGYCILQKGI